MLPPIEAINALLVWACLGTVAVVLWRPLVRRTGWAPVPTLLLILTTGLVLAMTLPLSVGAGSQVRLERCLSDPPGQIGWAVRHFGARGLEDYMNVLLWLAPGFFAVLATRRLLAPALIAAGFVVVELLQALDPGRWCDPQDWAYNSGGVALGALAAVITRRGRVR